MREKFSSTEDNSESEDGNQLPYETLHKLKLAIESEIDEFMRGVGISNPERFTNEEGWRVLRRGSALVFIGATIDNSVVTLRAFSEIMDLPSDKDLILPLMRELLEINAILPNECRFAIHGNSVIAASSKIITEYSEIMVPMCLHFISEIADNYDDYLIEKYGGTSRRRS